MRLFKYCSFANPVLAMALCAMVWCAADGAAENPEPLKPSQDLAHLLRSNVENPTEAFINLDEHALSSLGVHDWGVSRHNGNDELAAEIIDYAKTFLGTPYGRGSKGPRRFDCSGFTGWIFRNFDIRLGASSRDQYTEGDKVERGDIRPGDLLFFSGSRGGKTIGHVGMAVEVKDDGEVVFIHASTSQGVTYSSYPGDPYYRSRYIGARRVITGENAEK
jgi:hypothetical protein